MSHAVKTRYLASFSPPYNTIESSLFCVSVRAFVCLGFRLFHSCSAILMSSGVFRIFFFQDLFFFTRLPLCFFFYFNCLLLDYWCLVYFCNVFLCCRAFDLWPPYICKSNMKYLSVQPGFAITDQLPADASTEQKVTWTFLDL